MRRSAAQLADIEAAKRCPLLRAFWHIAGVCDGCGRRLGAGRRVWCSARCQRAWEREHYWRDARVLARRRAKWRCQVPGCDGPCDEINHKEPRAGLGYGTSCGHHAANLEGLCHAHHVAVTRAQRAARRAGAPGPFR